jgi:hypothetical protein
MSSSSRASSTCLSSSLASAQRVHASSRSPLGATRRRRAAARPSGERARRDRRAACRH